MINAIGSTMQMPSMQFNQSSMTSEERISVQALLADFSADDLSEIDAMSIVEGLSSAGIAPSQELAQIMAESGFDAQAIGEMAGVNDAQMPPPPPQNEMIHSTEILSFLEELLEDFDGQLSNDEQQSILSQVQSQFGMKQSDSIIDIRA
ncbi:hypothetical protein [Shewanella surugensis]|uniref:Orphan protein n=1 Tax=Shewanella surugensis TaxID=212020 RepID=A0ABT0LJ55_9GAMM|nr:hypothetical protein [Shewanella surugensis]MCL1127718.1 hypothetical protein [Shewanella surugensis]